MSRVFALLILAAVALPGCQKGGLVFFPGDGFEAEVVGTSKAGFAAPDGIAWRGGTMYLADECGHAVLRFDGKKTTRLADADSGLQSPEDLVVAEDGTVFFTDDDAGGLWQIDPSGKVRQLATAQQGMPSTEGLALAPNGNLLVGDGETHTVFEVTRAGKVSVLVGPEAGIQKPESMAFDSQGNLYIADNRQNIVFLRDRDGKLSKLLTAANGLGQPESICICNGDLYITDDEGGKLYRYRPTGGLQTVAVFAGRLQNVQGVTAGEDGGVLITVQDLKRGQGIILRVGPRPVNDSRQVAGLVGK